MISTFIPLGIHSSDLIQTMRRQSLDVKPWRLRYAASHGHIPQPFTTASGDLAWRADDVPAVVAYFQNPRRPGRPRKATR
jgi:hypothetical protein